MRLGLILYKPIINQFKVLVTLQKIPHYYKYFYDSTRTLVRTYLKMPKTTRKGRVDDADEPARARSDEDTDEDEPAAKRQRTSSTPRKDEQALKVASKADDQPGFTLKLADNQQIRVSQSESQQLQDSCAFFHNAFRHGTLESQHRVISKPDWTMETATSILELIQKKTFTVPSDYAAFKEAADQILLSIRVIHPVSGTNIQNDPTQVQSIADTWKASTSSFEMDMTTWNASHQRRSLDPIWEDLLVAGTVFVDQEQEGLQIQVVSEEDEPTEPANLLTAGSFCPLTLSVFHTCARLSESLRNPRNRRETANQNKPACMALPLYLGGKQLLQTEFPEMEFLSIETNNVPTVNMTRVTALPKDLRRVVEKASEMIAPVHLNKLCYLLIPEPPIDMLGKLITACRQCRDDPGTLGWDLEKNQFCTLKTLEDTMTILDALVDPETPMATKGTIRLVNVDMTAAPEWLSY